MPVVVARALACCVGTRADDWRLFSPDGGAEKNLDTARKSTCATSPTRGYRLLFRTHYTRIMPVRGKVRKWQIDHIRQGLREAKAGKFVPKAEVSRVIARLRRK